MLKPERFTVEYLRLRLRYEPDTGKLFWNDFDGNPQKWRSRFPGREAFTSKPRGYLNGKLDNIPVRANRVAWAIYHGNWPEGYIDHINGDPSDNRIVNLRDIPPKENGLNLRMMASNTSGVNGVYRFKRNGKWRAYITFAGQQHHLGFFDCLESARIARAKADEEFGFSARHGRPSTLPRIKP